MAMLHFVIKSTCFSSINMFFYPGNTLCNELMQRHHVSVNLIFNIPIMSVQATCCIKDWFPYDLHDLMSNIDQLHIPDTSTKIYANWMGASSLLLCLKNDHYFCMHRLADKRTQWPSLFREWFCNSEANRHEICMILRRVIIKVSSHEIKDDVQT